MFVAIRRIFELIENACRGLITFSWCCQLFARLWQWCFWFLSSVTTIALCVSFTDTILLHSNTKLNIRDGCVFKFVHSFLPVNILVMVLSVTVYLSSLATSFVTETVSFAVVAMITPQSFGVGIGQGTLLVINLTWVRTKVVILSPCPPLLVVFFCMLELYGPSSVDLTCMN